MSSSIRRQLEIAALSTRRTNTDEVNLFLSHYGPLEDESKECLDIVRQMWREDPGVKASERPLGSAHGVSISSSAESPSSSELLRVILGLESIARGGIWECLKCINEGYIGGRGVIYCVSEMRLFFTTLTSSPLEEIQDNIAFLKVVASLCLYRFLRLSNRMLGEEGVAMRE